MEHNVSRLDFFSSSVIQYSNDVLIHKNCVSSTFRKNSVKNEEDIEFSFHLDNPTELKGRVGESASQVVHSTCLPEEDLQKLRASSQTWSLHIAETSIKGSKLCLKLNRCHAFHVVLNDILTQKSNYGKFSTVSQKVTLSTDTETIMYLTEKRLNLVKSIAENILACAGRDIVSVDEQSDSLKIHFSCRNVAKESQKLIICGAVVNSATGSKESCITSEDYFQLRLKDMQHMAAHKYWETTNVKLLQELTQASVTYDLVQVKPSNVVSINFEPSCTRFREFSSKGAAFVLYNCARVASIRKQFMDKVADHYYPSLPSLEDTDFSLLKEQEEWYILFNFLMEYPSLVQKTANNLLAGNANIHHLCSFITKLCSLFSVYYRRVRILLEPREHLVSTIHVRMWFLLAVEQVLENTLAVLNIAKLEEM